MNRPITVLIADDEELVVRAMTNLLGADSSFQVVASARDAAEAVRMAESHRPMVALIDVRMPGGGPQAAREIRNRSPETKLVALSAYDDRATIVEMLRAGAAGYVVKGGTTGEIIESLRRVVRGEPAFSTDAASRAMDELASRLQEEEQHAALRRDRSEQIRRVLRGDGLTMAYQPIFDLRSGAAVGHEALARFSLKPRRGPDVWFEEAAGVGLGIDLEIEAARLALDDMARIPVPMYLALNLSPDAASSGRLLQMLATGQPNRLVIEITEHAKVEDYEHLSGSLSELRSRGLRLAIDDAGAGFASLRHILRLAPDLIKIDVSITREINTSSAAHALAAALQSFAVEIGATIVAEGIETQQELAALRELGITGGQGYYLARPGPLPGTTRAEPTPARHLAPPLDPD